jgi:predicted transcriptional regulator
MKLACMAIQQPYADLVVRGVKDVENRGSAMPSTLRGQWCAIYASKTLAPVGSWIQAIWIAGSRQEQWPWEKDISVARKQCTRGAIVGLVRWRESQRYYLSHEKRSPWARPGAHHWTYSDRILLAEPVPLPDGGRQNLNWYLDDATYNAVLDAAKYDKRLMKERSDAYTIAL